MKISRYCLVAFVFILNHSATTAQLTYKELKVLYDSAWTYKNLQMIPIKFKPRGEGEPAAGSSISRPISLSEALIRHKIKVQEMQYENGADVNWLQITNHSKQNVVVQGGEVLEGASKIGWWEKQNLYHQAPPIMYTCTVWKKEGGQKSQKNLSIEG